jgi:excisionase family DNA binding protein
MWFQFLGPWAEAVVSGGLRAVGSRSVASGVTMIDMRDSDAMDSLAEQAESPLDGLLRPTEVAQMLGVSRTWLYAAAKDGRIPCVRLGGPDGPVRFVERDLVAWLHRARVGWIPGESTVDTARRAAAA